MTPFSIDDFLRWTRQQVKPRRFHPPNRFLEPGYDPLSQFLAEFFDVRYVYVGGQTFSLGKRAIVEDYETGELLDTIISDQASYQLPPWAKEFIRWFDQTNTRRYGERCVPWSHLVEELEILKARP